MTLPACVDRRLSQQPLRVVSIGTDDRIIITPDQCLMYRTAGLVQDRQVAQYSYHGLSVDLTTGRRKTTITLAGPGSQSQQLDIPANYTAPALAGIITGVLYGHDIIANQPETVRRTAEKTVVVAGSQVFIYSGDGVWGKSFEKYTAGDIDQMTVSAGDNQLLFEGEIPRQHRRICGSAETIRSIKEAIDTRSSETPNGETVNGQNQTERSPAATTDHAELHECLDAIHSELQTLQTMLEKTTESTRVESVSRDQ